MALDISYSFRFADYDALSNAIRTARRRKAVFGFYWFVVIANFMSAALIARTGQVANAFINALIGVLMLSVFFIFVPIMRRWNYHRLDLDGKTIHISIDDEGVRSAQQGVKGAFEWNAFSRFSSTRQHAFLWINGLQALIMPFDAFKSDVERDTFLNFIATKIPLER